jgi:hypothetical protein
MLFGMIFFFLNQIYFSLGIFLANFFLIFFVFILFLDFACFFLPIFFHGFYSLKLNWLRVKFLDLTEVQDFIGQF